MKKTPFSTALVPTNYYFVVTDTFYLHRYENCKRVIRHCLKLVLCKFEHLIGHETSIDLTEEVPVGSFFVSSDGVFPDHFQNKRRTNAAETLALRKRFRS